MSRSPLSEYYQKVGLSPVEHELASTRQLELHERKRRNLIEFYLHLPFRLWKGASVLEFGPASGENALVAAKNGAKLTLVEPLDYLVAKLRQKFSDLGLEDSIDAVHLEVLEKFESPMKYEQVIAEGFVHFVQDKRAALAKLGSFVSPHGFLVLSVIHPSGTFLEFVRKFYLSQMIFKTGAASSTAPAAPATPATLERAMECAKKLFLPDFQKINHSRSFESWIGDTLLNPIYRKNNFLDLEQIWEALPRDFHLYSAWPNVASADHLRWHKDILKRDEFKAGVLEGYRARYAHFLASVPSQGEIRPLNRDDAQAVAQAIEDALDALDRAIGNPQLGPDESSESLARLERKLSAAAGAESSHRVVGECVKLLRAIDKSRTVEDFARAYMEREELRRCWGSPGHYYVFQKSDLFA